MAPKGWNGLRLAGGTPGALALPRTQRCLALSRALAFFDGCEKALLFLRKDKPAALRALKA